MPDWVRAINSFVDECVVRSGNPIGLVDTISSFIATGQNVTNLRMGTSTLNFTGDFRQRMCWMEKEILLSSLCISEN